MFLADYFLEVMGVFEKRIERLLHSASPVTVEVICLFLIGTSVGGVISIVTYEVCAELSGKGHL